MTGLLIIVIIFFMYQTIRDLIAYTDPWTYIQWILLAVNIIFLPVLFLLGKRYLKESKEKAAQREEQEKEFKQKQRSIFDDEYDKDGRFFENPEDYEEDEESDELAETNDEPKADDVMPENSDD